MILDTAWECFKTREGLAHIDDSDLSTTKRAFFAGAKAWSDGMDYLHANVGSQQEFDHKAMECYKDAIRGSQSLVPDPESDTRH